MEQQDTGTNVEGFTTPPDLLPSSATSKPKSDQDHTSTGLATFSSINQRASTAKEHDAFFASSANVANTTTFNDVSSPSADNVILLDTTPTTSYLVEPCSATQHANPINKVSVDERSLKVVAGLDDLSLLPSIDFNQTRPSPTLNGMPGEVLIAIVSLLPRRIPELLPVALVSSKFRDLVEPFMYHTIDIRQWDSGHENEKSRNTGFCSILQSYIDLLERNQRIRPMVRIIRMPGINTPIEYSACYQREYIDPIRHRTTLLLSLAPNVRSVDLASNGNSDDVLQLPHISQLMSIEFKFSDHGQKRSCLQPDQSLPILARHFGIPSLRHMKIEGLWARGRVGCPEKIFPISQYETSFITSLQVTKCCDKDLEHLPSMIRTIKALRYVVIELTSRSRDFSYQKLTPGHDLTTALLEHTSSIEELVIASRCSFLRDEQFTWNNILSFKNLRRVCIPESFLVDGSDKKVYIELPRNLKWLQLQQVFEGDEEEREGREARLKYFLNHQHALPCQLSDIVWWESWDAWSMWNAWRGEESEMAPWGLSDSEDEPNADQEWLESRFPSLCALRSEFKDISINFSVVWEGDIFFESFGCLKTKLGTNPYGKVPCT